MNISMNSVTKTATGAQSIYPEWSEMKTRYIMTNLTKAHSIICLLQEIRFVLILCIPLLSHSLSLMNNVDKLIEYTSTMIITTYFMSSQPPFPLLVMFPVNNKYIHCYNHIIMLMVETGYLAESIISLRLRSSSLESMALNVNDSYVLIITIMA